MTPEPTNRCWVRDLGIRISDGETLIVPSGLSEHASQLGFARMRWLSVDPVFVAALALLLDRALEKNLHAAGCGLSTPFARQALEIVRCVEVELGPRRKICVTRGNQHVTAVLRALGIAELDPPAPPEGRESIM